MGGILRAQRGIVQRKREGSRKKFLFGKILIQLGFTGKHVAGGNQTPERCGEICDFFTSNPNVR